MNNKKYKARIQIELFYLSERTPQVASRIKKDENSLPADFYFNKIIKE